MHAPREEGKVESRWNEWLTGQGETPPLPDLGPLQFYAELFSEAGRVEINDNGRQPLSWVALEAFGRVMSLERDDVRALRAMSDAYLSEYRAGDNALRLPPWNGEPL